MTDDAQASDARTNLRTLRAVGPVALLALIALVASLDRFTAVDDEVWRAVLLLRGCSTDRAVESAITLATRALAVLLVAAVILRVRASGPRPAWPWLGTWLLGLFASKALKHVLARERPSALPDLALGYSFPSAHVMNGVLATIAVLALARGFRHRRRWYVAASLATSTLAAGRILVGHHWASDALGGGLAALALAGLGVPALVRRPVLGPALIATLLAGAFMLDRRVSTDRPQLPSPLVGRRATLVELDVAPETLGLRGAWENAGPEPPFGSYRWLEGVGSLTLDVPATALTGGRALQLAFAGRPGKPTHSCGSLAVAVNGVPLARFVPFVGWRQYRFRLPAGLVRVGANDLAFAVEGAEARFGLTYVRLAAVPSAAE